MRPLIGTSTFPIQPITSSGSERHALLLHLPWLRDGTESYHYHSLWLHGVWILQRDAEDRKASTKDPPAEATVRSLQCGWPLPTAYPWSTADLHFPDLLVRTFQCRHDFSTFVVLRICPHDTALLHPCTDPRF
jgi:hypothetical protein